MIAIQWFLDGRLAEAIGTEGWVEGLRQAGYSALTVDDLIRLRIAGVSMQRERRR